MAKPLRVLVTGGAGFIGSHLVDRLLAEGLEVIVLDNFLTGSLENISLHMKDKKFHLIRGDLRNPEHVKRAVSNVDTVFHKAAISDARESDLNLINEVNVTGTLVLLNSCMDAGVEHFIFASSAAVYGEINVAREDVRPEPISAYGASKISAETYVKVFSHLYGLKAVSLRIFNVYGSRQRFDARYSAVITSFINRLMGNSPPIIYGGGKQTRDFIHVKDVVDADMLTLHYDKGRGEVFNIASGKSISVNHLAKVLQRIMNKEHLTPVYAAPITGDIKHCKADIQKSRNILRFKSKVKLEDGLQKLIDEYKIRKKAC
ncbi:MAG TPA: SDR family NAD(P)-dependent oxidoreductase [Acidobacteriota bacterium]|nr:SDR family NAD(P)-dependent oxidoreductase [Acidobacteriota bacterium]